MKHKRLLPLIIACALFIENLDSTVISTSLPAIALDLGADPIALKLALTAQFVAVFGARAEALAVIVALTLRLTWTVAEVALGLILYAMKPALPPGDHGEPPNEKPDA